jgi:predicted nucleic-acid-binding protein
LRKISVDTNVLVRAAIRDNPQQMQAAQATLAAADIVAISTHALCEFAWVMRQGYKQAPTRIAAGIRLVIGAANVAVDRPAADAGLAMLDAGGDFADGVIAFEGRAFGADKFVSFDKRAVDLLLQQGESAELLS